MIEDIRSLPEVFCKNGVLKNFPKITGKRLCQSLFFNKVVGLRSETLLKRDSGIEVFCEFCEIFKNSFFYRTPPVATSEKMEKVIKVAVKYYC